VPELVDLTEDTTPDPTDIIYASDSAGTVDKKVQLANLPTFTVQVKTTTYVAVGRDVVLASASGGAWVLTLPAVTAGRWVTVKKTDASANAITVTPASGTIDGAATYPITTQWLSRDFISDGTDWFIV
jgi:hypothetical protein